MTDDLLLRLRDPNNVYSQQTNGDIDLSRYIRWLIQSGSDAATRITELVAENERAEQKAAEWKYMADRRADVCQQAIYKMKASDIRAESAERALAEAVEVMRPFSREADGPTLSGAELGDEWRPFLHRSYSEVGISNGDLRAARRFVQSQEGE